MPNLNDVIEMAEGLEKAAVIPIDRRCVAVRNRNSSCRKCVDACIADAISVGENELTVSGHACVSCGCCVDVCPTEALYSIDPTEEDFASAVATAREAADGETVIACARMAARMVADPDMYAVVPCLGRLDVALLTQLGCAGAGTVWLVDGTCHTCKYRDSVPAIDATVETARMLLAIPGCDTELIRTSEFPPSVALDEKKAESAARRGFFTSAGSMVKDAAVTAAQKTIEDKLNAQKRPKSIREKLGVAKGGQLPRFKAERNMVVLDALYSAGGPAAEGEVLDTRLFGTFSVDTDACTGCGMCVLFCPTGAIEFSPLEAPDAEMRLAEFSAADCTQCRLCEDCCTAGAAHISSVVAVDDLFDFEPRLVEMAKPSPKPKLFGNR